MAPWDAAKKTNAPPPPRPSIEIPQWLGPVVTPAETTAATPTPSRPDTATSRTASPREARPGSVPFIDATRERSGGQGEVKSKSSTPVVISRHESPRETRLSSVASVDAKRASAGGQAQCFDVSRYSDGSRTVHRLTVDPVARIASATTSPLTIDPRDFKEAISEVLETNPSSRILKLVSNKDDGKNETLVFESAGAGAGKVAGSVHVRWFVGWLREVNPALKYTNNSIKPTQKAK
ncbi:hypothetical protein QBC39DRAFT_366953 [Podospora conica]|nr:hypothetical protein QBC39DRAFT_366953 [Schizothecium conicum]